MHAYVCVFAVNARSSLSRRECAAITASQRQLCHAIVFLSCDMRLCRCHRPSPLLPLPSLLLCRLASTIILIDAASSYSSSSAYRLIAQLYTSLIVVINRTPRLAAWQQPPRRCTGEIVRTMRRSWALLNPGMQSIREYQIILPSPSHNRLRVPVRACRFLSKFRFLSM